MDYEKKGRDGVFIPKLSTVESVQWRGGPLERYVHFKSAINTFCTRELAEHAPSAASESFVEQGTFKKFMCMPSLGESCLAPGTLHLHDCGEQEERQRANLPLAEVNMKAQSMTELQWYSFAGLRACPCSQIRNLCVGLRKQTLVLDSPQVRF